MSKAKPSNKPLSKKVSTLNEQLRRRRGIRELKQRFLIVCEDQKSAPNYFESLKKEFDLDATSVRVAGSGGKTQPVQVVEVAAEMKERAADPGGENNPFDQVWCVIDGDYGIKIRNARAKAKAKGIELAISTKCFEYWILLHFESNDTSSMDCDGVIRFLKATYIPVYEKGKSDFHQIVKSVRDACTRAEKIRSPGVKRGELPEDQNPCSEVYKLVNAILKA